MYFLKGKKTTTKSGMKQNKDVQPCDKATSSQALISDRHVRTPGWSLLIPWLFPPICFELRFFHQIPQTPKNTLFSKPGLSSTLPATCHGIPSQTVLSCLFHSAQHSRAVSSLCWQGAHKQRKTEQACEGMGSVTTMETMEKEIRGIFLIVTKHSQDYYLKRVGTSKFKNYMLGNVLQPTQVIWESKGCVFSLW